jgi:hypothetical protein
MAGPETEFSVAADASHFLTVECTVFIKKTAYESVEGHRAVSLSHQVVGH